MIAVLQPGPLTGRVTAPPSKSMAHRAVLAAGLARGMSRIRNLEYSQDVQATLNAVRQLGAKVQVREHWADIEGRGGFATLRGPIDCGESGSTLRFLIPVCSLTGQQVRFCGRGRLMQRPQGPYAEIFAGQGRMFCQNESGILIKGSLRPGEYRLAGDVSSQFISGLLFALPLMLGDSAITITPPFESRSYVDLTLAALADFGPGMSKEEWAELTPEEVRLWDERISHDGGFTQSLFDFYSRPLSDKIWEAQRYAIRRIADRESCVLVGRNADYILREFEHVLRVFIYADRDWRICHMESLMPDVSRLEIEADTRSVDRARRSYCMKYTGQTYGYAGNYDLTVNTGSLGFDKAAELVCSAAEMI